MRHYTTDSPEASARILALALLADGAIDLSELRTLQSHDIAKCVGLDDFHFDKVIHADGRLAGSEAIIVSKAMQRWDLDLLRTAHTPIPQVRRVARL